MTQRRSETTCTPRQEALSSKLAVCLQHFGAALVGVIIGLVKGWKMALVMLSLARAFIPILPPPWPVPPLCLCASFNLDQSFPALKNRWRFVLTCDIPLLSQMPLLGTAGALFGKTIQAGQKEQSEAYAKASALAKETIGAIRVVAAYGGEERFMKAFAAACLPAEKSERRSALSGGFSVGFLWLVMFGTCARAGRKTDND